MLLVLFRARLMAHSALQFRQHPLKSTISSKPRPRSHGPRRLSGWGLPVIVGQGISKPQTLSLKPKSPLKKVEAMPELLKKSPDVGYLAAA